uniref:Uncharacterized protein n=1 Tax=Anguilla anguilla TaxID=7936 RepID=A0A0E9U8D0_ANGAN
MSCVIGVIFVSILGNIILLVYIVVGVQTG